MQQIPDMQQLLRLAQSPAGQQLIAALKRTGGDELEKAAALASGGNMEQAQRSLASTLNTPEIQKLLQQLEGQL